MHTPRHIQLLIDENLSRREPILDLCRQALLEVPPEIRGLTHLEQLLLADNAIQRLPAWLAELPKLRFIQLNINPLHDVGKVPNLVLDWGVWWRLRPDPQQVAGLWLRWEEGEMLEEALALPALRWLDLSGQRLREIPERVLRLERLEVLRLEYNKLTALPYGIAQLQHLTLLDLGSNGLTALPPEIAQLQ
ncbi:leucine-rich repeat domain-containing protein, partial [Endothiovibrio diazotrophicus]